MTAFAALTVLLLSFLTSQSAAEITRINIGNDTHLTWAYTNTNSANITIPVFGGAVPYLENSSSTSYPATARKLGQSAIIRLRAQRQLNNTLPYFSVGPPDGATDHPDTRLVARQISRQTLKSLANNMPVLPTQLGELHGYEILAAGSIVQAMVVSRECVLLMECIDPKTKTVASLIGYLMIEKGPFTGVYGEEVGNSGVQTA
ncbi:MAG: hypothetical protein Q9218_003781 [Villophora microphyllina]